MFISLTEFLKNENSSNLKFIYHGTGKGQALSIQKDGYMKTNANGEIEKSISFTSDIKVAQYYAKYKGDVILRTPLTADFKKSERIKNNKDFEWITFNLVPSSALEILSGDGTWRKLTKWDIIFDEPIK